MKRTLSIISVFALLSMAQTTFAQSVSSAKSLMEKGCYLEAAKQLRPLADGGNAEAQYLAATLFFEGNGVTKNAQQGVKYATMAADQGYEEAVLLLANRADKPFNILSSYCERFPEMQKCQPGQLLGLCYIFGKGVAQDMEKGFTIIEGTTDFAQILHDNDELRNIYKEYYKQQFAPSTYVISMTDKKEDLVSLIAINRRLLLLDYKENREIFNNWLQYAQGSGQTAAMAVLSYLYLTGWGTLSDMVKAKEWAQKSANGGSELGQTLLNDIAQRERKIQEEQRKKKIEEDKARQARFRVEEPAYAAATCKVCNVSWKDGKLSFVLNVSSKGGRIDFGSGMKICLKRDMSLTDINGKRIYNRMTASIKGLARAQTNNSTDPATYILPSNKAGQIHVTISDMPSQGELGEIVINLWFYGDGGSTVRIKHLSWGY